MRSITVDLGERSYPILIGSGLLQGIGERCREAGLPQRSPLLVVSDSEVAPRYLSVVEASLRGQGYTVVSHVIPSGEASKSLAVYEEVITTAIQAGLDRSSAVLALGGGVVGDLAGYVAATYMRGIGFVQIPTTILAHDSSVGGKVAVNHPLAKNMIGAFYQPSMVLYDLDTLRTLPPREVSSGLAEVVKHGLILDKEFAYWCREHASELLALDAEALGYALERGCAIKARVVGTDERENGLRAILNLGHTIGHAIEAVGGYGVFLHGEAIAIGMAGSALLAAKLGRDREIYEDTVSMLSALSLPVRLPAEYSEDALMEAMMHDKKFKEGKMTFIVPDSIGAVSIINDIQQSDVREVIAQLKKEGSPW
ncbi:MULTISPECIES: 3-dehydroquinate synthase [unclassified Paenibacillus]|uniref:3-dehydroquinate synthase n=1 Tax=unclassified Paenibacillus TaxID=185978 RepID=UPI0024072A2B|nr:MULTISPECIES: 3-dehydroquinate synthase [unclassified Paenibacillus]MDF9840317.1 3-dehydroquinate synthase [Paenibacillus sp. PastF-2]MDF9846899.1 3-dehydroquinate synthase [Paenibacillus sp. PastM-2]MDF9853471.1 3-dehydroquinate synthase [Paenibacillus sp. PastF-1]MDH6479042.1 3-dehydroquinate synthase [Paenibacillus sp. PastH-2]MDH6506774.1 3-dehydroquinate synthase [Paenibacillus sp. PastM-3]